MADLPPWLDETRATLAQALGRGRLPHALLIRGPAGLGKAMLARHLAKGLLCDAGRADLSPCGSCPSCNWVAAASHPDLVTVTPLEPGKPLQVDQIRALTDASHFKAQPDHFRVFVLEPADAMNAQAANALLKTLEEPVPGVVLILVTAMPERLPATVRSRCQAVTPRLPAWDEAVAWLRLQGDLTDPELCLSLANGMPFTALEMAGSDRLAWRADWLEDVTALLGSRHDPLAVATRWAKLDPAELLTALNVLLADMLRLRVAPQCARVANRDQGMALATLVAEVSLVALLQLQEKLIEARQAQRNNLNFNMIVEGLCIALSNLREYG